MFLSRIAARNTALHASTGQQSIILTEVGSPCRAEKTPLLRRSAMVEQNVAEGQLL